MTLTFASVSEDRPGPALARLFADYWPAYRKWWASEGVSARPTYMECRRAIRRHMPEMSELYDEIVELVGGGDAQARFLSFYGPPKYLTGCSQAIWPGSEPLLVRNYDYDPRAFDATVLRTAWGGRQVMGMSDGLWGLLDGINDAGLAVSLTFGGRREVGLGFGVPLILRYVLQTCDTADAACEALARVPCHMSYNVTVLDRARDFATVFLAPDREAVITNTPVATNHQERVEWSSHARFTATVERERFLLQRLTLHPETKTRFIQAFLKPPLYSTAFSRGFGTLYTAAYQPRRGRMRLFWPGSEREFQFGSFAQERLHVLVPERA
jgi:predicted choloylglycine hydrolase